MSRKASLGFVGVSLALALWTGAAAAETVCGTVAEFNAQMQANATAAADVTLTYDLTGVNPGDFHNSKGSIAQMRNTECNGGQQDAVIKVYGTSEPLNTSHLPGTLKLEYGNKCCAAADCGEKWASPNPSEVIFADGTEQCKVTMWVKPDSVGYKLECGALGTFEAVGDNDEQNEVNQIALLELLLSEGGNTWEMPNASAQNDQVCWVAVAPNQQYTTVAVSEDVTTGPTHANNVFPDVTDLAVEAGDNEAYLKFVVPAVGGLITNATLFMHARPESFAEGDGGEVYVVTSNDWSESTLTYSTRPPKSGASLGRIGPTSADQWVSVDLGTAVSGPGTYSFAVISPPTDGNGSHFYSKEGSAPNAAYLRLSYDPNAGGAPGAGGTGGGDPTGSGGSGWSGSSGSGSGGATGAGANSADPETASGDSGGCSLTARSRRLDASFALISLSALLWLARRRRR